MNLRKTAAFLTLQCFIFQQVFYAAPTDLIFQDLNQPLSAQAVDTAIDSIPVPLLSPSSGTSTDFLQADQVLNSSSSSSDSNPTAKNSVRKSSSGIAQPAVSVVSLTHQQVGSTLDFDVTIQLNRKVKSAQIFHFIPGSIAQSMIAGNSSDKYVFELRGLMPSLTYGYLVILTDLDGSRTISSLNSLTTSDSAVSKVGERESSWMNLSSYLKSNGQKIEYESTGPHRILIHDASGKLQETIAIPVPPVFNESEITRLKLSGGVEALYRQGEIVQINTEAGIRITNFRMDSSGLIQDALAQYPNKTLEVIRDGKVLRRISPDKSIVDFIPTGKIVREIPASDVVLTYLYQKTADGKVLSTRVTGSNGSESVYDELGLLKEIHQVGQNYFYDRTGASSGYILRLNRSGSSSATGKVPVEFRTDAAGFLTRVQLQDGTVTELVQGKPVRILDPSGKETTIQQQAGGQEMPQTLSLQKGGTAYTYDASGFLSQISTSAGVIHREADGPSDPTVDLILESVGGDIVRDFELDPQGRILKGILETKDGIKQKIENGKLIGFETVDGRSYSIQGSEAVLDQWNWKDGTRILFTGTNIKEILFPDKSSIGAIVMDSSKQVTSYVKTLVDGIKIEYGPDGFARKIGDETISYIREGGEIRKIIFEGPNTRREFTPSGVLTHLTENGIHMEIQNSQIQKIWTWFGTIEKPQWNSAGSLSGQVKLLNGTVLSVQSGELREAVSVNGTHVLYENGRIVSLETKTGKYKILYEETADKKLQNIKIRLDSLPGSPVYSLVPFLNHPEEMAPAVRIGDNDIAQLRTILLPRPLDSVLDQDPSKMKTESAIYGDIPLVRSVQDLQRGEVYPMNGIFSPEWMGINPSLRADTPGAVSDLMDMNGDGLVDWVSIDSSDSKVWQVQWNNGHGSFDPPVKWTGVENLSGFSGSALRTYYNSDRFALTSDLIDMNGDGRPDRVLVGKNDKENDVWFIQINSGKGFESKIVWKGNIQPAIQKTLEAQADIRVWSDGGGGAVIQSVADLIDMDGDGLPDRIIRPNIGPFDRWFFQKNLGDGFADAVLWMGVDLRFNTNSKTAASFSSYLTSDSHRYDGTIAELWAKQNAFNPNPCAGKSSRNCKPQNAQDIWTDFRNSLGGTLAAAGAGELLGVIRGDPDTKQPTDGFKILLVYLQAYAQQFTETSSLVDINGDQKPDRVFADEQGRWFVQLNHGKGFDAATLWAASVRVIPGMGTLQMGSAISLRKALSNGRRNMAAELKDVNGDGLPDRITVENAQPKSVSHSWWVEINTGHGFNAPVLWNGIEGSNENETSVGQENQDIMSDYRLSHNSAVISDLMDVNGDKIPDRVMYRESEKKWLVQFGTGHGFLPVQETNIQGIIAPTGGVDTTLYDYLHVSLKAGDGASAKGTVKITAKAKGAVQEWTVTGLGADWKDFYLPVDKSKVSMESIEVKFIPASGTISAGTAAPVYMDDLAYVQFRPSEVKDWLNDLLAQENGLSNMNKIASSPAWGGILAMTSLQAPEGGEAISKILNAETKLKLGSQNQIIQFQTLAGSVSKVENGTVKETVLPDQTKITFQNSDTQNPQKTVQTITQSDGTRQTAALTYGNIRTVERPGKSPLQYSYEYVTAGTGSSLSGPLSTVEIMSVYDPDTKVTEKYRDGRLISRSEPDGVTKEFIYSAMGELSETRVSYKGRLEEIFQNQSDEVTGHHTITTEGGVKEEYDAEGRIVFNTTPEGLTYEHVTAKAQQIAITSRSETLKLPDGKTVTINVPLVSVTKDPNGEAVHQVILKSYKNQSGDESFYEGGVLTHVKMHDGTKIYFERIETKESVDEKGYPVIQRTVLDAKVIRSDHTVTEYKNGKPYKVSSAGKEILLEEKDGALINPAESARYHLEQASALWKDLVTKTWNDFSLPPAQVIKNEYSSSGKLAFRWFSEGILEVYDENGRVSKTLALDGELLIDHTYDAEGNPVEVYMGGARRRLESARLELEAQIAVEKIEAIRYVEDRNAVLKQTIEGLYVAVRDNLLALKAEIEAQRDRLASINVRGKSVQDVINMAFQKIQVGVDQVNAALAGLDVKKAQGLNNLDSSVTKALTDIETESTKAFSDLAAKIVEAKKAMTRQELLPVIYHWYRKMMGRDPSNQEFESYVELVLKAWNGERGQVNLALLKTSLTSSAEYSARSNEVQAIKNAVEKQLLSLQSPSDRAAFAAKLGIEAENRVDLSAADLQKILTWLKGLSLHFGQSAFIALESLLKEKPNRSDNLVPGVSLRINLAARLIMTDILSGVITLRETSDLLISMYAFRKTAAYYGVELTPLKMDYEALKALYDQACASKTDCRAGIVLHVDGNHYIILKKMVTRVVDGKTVEEITFTEPGKGPESALEEITMDRESFSAKWISRQASAGSDQSRGYVITHQNILKNAALNQMPLKTHYAQLTTSEEMRVRGAFFFVYLMIAILAIVHVIEVIVVAIVHAIVLLLEGIIHAIGTFVSAMSDFVTNLLAGNFLGAFQGLFSGIFHGIGQLGGAFVNAAGAFQTSLTAGMQGVFSGGAASTFASLNVNVSLFGLELKGLGSILGALGVNPKISRVIGGVGDIVSGFAGIVAGNPLSLAQGLARIAGGTGGILQNFTHLSPVMTSLVSAGAAGLGSLLSAGINTGSITGALAGLKSATPFLLKEFASAGLAGLGSVLNLNPAITALINIPVRAAIGTGIASIFDADHVNVSSLFASIKNGLASGLQSIGMGGLNLSSSDVTHSIESLIGKNGLFSNILSTIKDTILHPFDTVGGIFRDFSQVVQEKGGLAKTLESFASSIFSPQTLEGILKAGGMSGILGLSQALTTLSTGQPAKELKINSVTSLFFNLAGALIGKKENGVTQTGTFGVDSFGKFALIAGQVLSILSGGDVFAGDVKNGQLQKFTIKDGKGQEVIIGSPEQKDGPIIIDGPDSPTSPTSSSYDLSFWNGLFNFVSQGFSLIFKDGKAQSVEMQNTSSALSPQTTDPNKSLYVLVNGIGNTSPSGAPDYIRNLQINLSTQSNFQVHPTNDIIVAPAFNLDGVFAKMLTAILGESKAREALQQMLDAAQWFQT
ncbi:MAG: hypothetical protein EXS63_05480, partial [Candidatus Omnitrophica bacterium]|nr:hypothetical protein [Candidatus Omnitrophota bacterium]